MCTSVVSCSDVVEKDAFGMRRFSMKRHCSEEGRNGSIQKYITVTAVSIRPECHILRLLIVHYASASGLCSRKASHTSLSCMFV